MSSDFEDGALEAPDGRVVEGAGITPGASVGRVGVGEARGEGCVSPCSRPIQRPA